MITDLLGRPIEANDWIVAAFKGGPAGVLRIGRVRVVRLSPRKEILVDWFFSSEAPSKPSYIPAVPRRFLKIEPLDLILEAS
jgi:hypothetical protein